MANDPGTVGRGSVALRHQRPIVGRKPDKRDDGHPVRVSQVTQGDAMSPRDYRSGANQGESDVRVRPGRAPRRRTGRRRRPRAPGRTASATPRTSGCAPSTPSPTPAHDSIGTSLGMSPAAAARRGRHAELGGHPREGRALGDPARAHLEQDVVGVGVRDGHEVLDVLDARGRRRCRRRGGRPPRGRAASPRAGRARPRGCRRRTPRSRSGSGYGRRARRRTSPRARCPAPPTRSAKPMPGTSARRVATTSSSASGASGNDSVIEPGREVDEHRAVGADADTGVTGRLGDGHDPARRTPGHEDDRERRRHAPAPGCRR